MKRYLTKVTEVYRLSTEKEAETALKKVDKTQSVENIIKESLRVLMG